jgi:D-alanine transaminase
MIRAAKELGIEVVERQFSPDQAKYARELIMAVTTKDLVPVVGFDGHRIGDGAPGHVTIRLARQFLRFTMHKT